MSILAARPVAGCPLCGEAGGVPVASAGRWRVIRAEDAAFPAFYRLVWREHVAEFSDLPAAERHECIDAVSAIETVLRETLAPTKINLATLGNVVPHLHWHVIARFGWDSHFPNPVWGAEQREPSVPAVQRLALPLAELDAAVAHALVPFGAE
ncbi:HIT family protein [Rivibacter subsaxonicus]|uniref:Diadenosine tetraphosphate (Ap4A) HIT family hydrolase n=1 Tax=Rivibacter subsaxonicus TaxID=457575 RepID=A0A4Q7VZF5_9BURK|nr:HIT family protein [Rivibacter subsaxonicus]RZU02254.1 diadenosine tetraphosphate (Ap4A) HIT family hydrolase [Rivibacter subsaxonicus]